MIPALLILVIAIASFAPHPIRGIVIILTAGLGLWYTMNTYKPYKAVPPMPSTPPEEKADDLLIRYGLDQSIDQTDPLRKTLVNAVDQSKNPNFKK